MEGRRSPSPLHAQPPLSVQALTKRYGGAAAVDGLALDCVAGRVVGLVGPNGCGKTTTLRCVTGLVAPDRGSVHVCGHRAGSTEARRSLAFVPDEPTGLDELTVSEYLALTRALFAAGAEFDHRAGVLLRAFALDARPRSALGALSHGQRRAVSVVAAFALARALTVVDEATAGLDPDSVIALREVVRAAARAGRAVVVATQDLHFAESCCDDAYLLARGRVAASGPLHALRASFGAASLEDVYVTAVGADRLEALRRDLDDL